MLSSPRAYVFLIFRDLRNSSYAIPTSVGMYCIARVCARRSSAPRIYNGSVKFEMNAHV